MGSFSCNLLFRLGCRVNLLLPLYTYVMTCVLIIVYLLMVVRCQMIEATDRIVMQRKTSQWQIEVDFVHPERVSQFEGEADCQSHDSFCISFPFQSCHDANIVNNR